MAARRAARIACAILTFGCAACGPVDAVNKSVFGEAVPEGEPGHVTGFLGAAVADEPRAALTAREVLSVGGNAADAAVALGFALSVTLPSRAGLGAGGTCVVYAPAADGPGKGTPEAVLFPPVTGGGGGDRPASVPMLPRGLFALHARYGHLKFEGLLGAAETLARSGVTVSRALSQDLAVVGLALAGDSNAAAVFAPGGQPLTEGGRLTQPDLGETLSVLRRTGVGDFYQGVFSRTVEAASGRAGGGLTASALHSALPTIGPALEERMGDDSVAWLPPPADGGVAAVAAARALAAGAAVGAAEARSLAVAARLRASGGDPASVLVADLPPARLGELPASTTFLTLDRDGDAVACAVTMDNLFGTGRMMPGTGVLLGAAPRRPPLLAAGIAWNGNLHAFRAAVGGSGQAEAAVAAAVALRDSLAAGQPALGGVTGEGRANVIVCPRYVPGDRQSCGFATDPRGAGLALGGD